VRNKIAELQLSLNSFWNRLLDVSVLEMKVFLDLIINIGIIPLPNSTGYWSSEWTTQVKYHGDVSSQHPIAHV
jgi:hypothetical protein